MGPDFLREARWLTAARAGGYLRLFALLNVATLVWLVATARGGIDRNGFLLGTDFISFWTAGRMAAGEVYDVAAHMAAQRSFFAQPGVHTAFFYPPVFLLLCKPLALLGYFPALGIWLVATGGAYIAAARLWLARLGNANPAWLLVAAFPAALIVVTHGQTAFLAAALLGSGALLVRERPWLAGALIGLAVFKPQLGVLIPLVLLLTGEWRTIAAAGATIVALALATTLAFGAPVWGEWLSVSSDAETAMAGGAIGFAKLQSVFAAARLLGAGEGLAYGLQAMFSLGVVAALARACWRRSYTLSHAAAMLAGAPLVTPFVLDYDFVLLGFPLLWLAAQTPRPWERIAVLAVFAAPAFARPLAMNTGVPILAALTLGLFILLVRRAGEAPPLLRS